MDDSTVTVPVGNGAHLRKAIYESTTQEAILEAVETFLQNALTSVAANS